MSRLFGVVFQMGEGGSPSFITCDSSDPLDWDNSRAEFSSVFEAREFAEECYSTLIGFDSYREDWQSIALHVVELEGCQGCGACVFLIPDGLGEPYHHVGALCSHGVSLQNVEV